jgi:hypothetical protein
VAALPAVFRQIDPISLQIRSTRRSPGLRDQFRQLIDQGLKSSRFQTYKASKRARVRACCRYGRNPLGRLDSNQSSLMWVRKRHSTYVYEWAITARL